jgi:hypothetical protein
MKLNETVLNTQHNATLDLSSLSIEEIGEEHLFNSFDTPMREDRKSVV